MDFLLPVQLSELSIEETMSLLRNRVTTDETRLAYLHHPVAAMRALAAGYARADHTQLAFLHDDSWPVRCSAAKGARLDTTRLQFKDDKSESVRLAAIEGLKSSVGIQTFRQCEAKKANNNVTLIALERRSLTVLGREQDRRDAADYTARNGLARPWGRRRPTR